VKPHSLIGTWITPRTCIRDTSIEEEEGSVCTTFTSMCTGSTLVLTDDSCSLQDHSDSTSRKKCSQTECPDGICRAPDNPGGSTIIKIPQRGGWTHTDVDMTLFFTDTTLSYMYTVTDTTLSLFDGGRKILFIRDDDNDSSLLHVQVISRHGCLDTK
jgi:hypothetical protein